MQQMLWIGNYESEEELINKANKGFSLVSAQVSQQNLINGIEQISGFAFDSINGSVLPPYPVYKDRIIPPVVWSHTDGARDISVGYRNRKYINRLYCKFSMIKAAQEWLDLRYQGNELIILVYSMRSSPMATACYIKKQVPTAKLFLIITDLPKYMDLGQSMFKAALKSVDWFFIKRMQKEFNGFILYASKMADYLKIPNRKWLLMEGSFECKEIIELSHDISKLRKKVIMYSGNLDLRYGIKLLLDAFLCISDIDAELWLTGRGNAEKYINECMKIDHRIKYFGYIPERLEVLKKQQEATLLVNMRLPSEKASSYCFPSKLFEYMATGIPVLSFKLGGIPEEYIEFLYIIQDENKQGIVNAIMNAFEFSDEERKLKGQRAKNFVLREKSVNMQCKKICEFIDDIGVLA